MKVNALVVTSMLTLGFSFASSSLAHSSMFDDYFVFDNSNEGLSAAEIRDILGPSIVTQTCSAGFANGYPCQAVDFRSFVGKRDLGGGSQNLNDIWGWTDPLTGKEIAIVGRQHGTAFVDVTDADEPIVLGFLPSRNGGSDTWRDMKVYNDHVFIVADGRRQRNHGLQVYDLTQLREIRPGSRLSESGGMDGFGNSHNIVINEDTGFAYAVGSNQCSGGLYMIDISEPKSPVYAGCFSSDGYTHDAQCVLYNGPDEDYQGREICVGYNEDTMTIIDVTDKANPTEISKSGYEGSRYTHQGWFLDEDQSVIILNDELDESRARVNTTSYIFDVSDLDQPREIGRYVAQSRAIDHNLYTRDGLIFEANYRAGLRILSPEANNPGKLREVGYFDTIPGSDSSQFSGIWSSYIYFESGNIILSDIGGGLFVVSPNWEQIEENRQ
ncbi:MAG: choice-of-anchor B family protein [Pseudobacteriovorax sp.]|nr:choice-of-anchor B family protein [Pseudobacteriovorax sp.]